MAENPNLLKKLFNAFDPLRPLPAPDDHVAWYNRSVELGDLGRFEEAVASYDFALKIKPDFHKAWYNRGIALRNLGRFEEAVANYD